MAFRRLEGVKQNIIDAVIEIGAESGFGAITARRVAAKCGISDFTVFHHYKTMKNLLKSAAEYYDNALVEMMAGYVLAGKSLYEIWDTMLQYLLDNPAGALYYSRYTAQVGYDPTVNNPRSGEFLGIARLLFGQNGRVLTDDQYLMMWDYVTTMALYYAEKIISGQMENSDRLKDYCRQIVFCGIDNIK